MLCWWAGISVRVHMIHGDSRAVMEDMLEKELQFLARINT